MARVGRAAGAALTVAGLLLALAVGVPWALGWHTYAITSGSMTGTADVGSLVVARDVPVDELVEGDVITYLPPPGAGATALVTHRLASIREAEGLRVMQTQGDANAAPDPWEFVLDAPSQPRMVMAVPWAGFVVLALGHPGARLLLVTLPAAVLALLFAREAWATWRAEDELAAASPTGGPPCAA